MTQTTYWSSDDTDNEPSIESDSDSNSGSFDIEFIEISTTDTLIKQLRERWWLFIDSLLNTSTTSDTPVDGNETVTDETGLFPAFTGLRFKLGGDKHTH